MSHLASPPPPSHTRPSVPNPAPTCWPGTPARLWSCPQGGPQSPQQSLRRSSSRGAGRGVAGRAHTHSPTCAHARPAVPEVITSTPTLPIPELRCRGKQAGLQASWGEGDPSRPCRPFSQVPAISTLPQGLGVSQAEQRHKQELTSAATMGRQPRPHGPASSCTPLPLPELHWVPEPGDPQPCFSQRTAGGWGPAHVH